MPIYEYSCPDCGAEFERMRKLSEPPLTECPDCGKQNVRKLISRTSFMLKGGGWYSDHYGLKGGASESSGAKSGGDGAAADSGATPAAAPAAAPSAPAAAPSTPTTSGS